MNCIKCGRDIAENAVFCSKCLEDMDAHPVKPGTPFQLPQRKAASPQKAQRKKTVSPEELVVQQRRTIKHLRITLLCVVLLLALTIGLVFYLAQDQAAQLAEDLTPGARANTSYNQTVSRETSR